MHPQTGISIIIPCYNDGRYIREAVESIYAQNTKLPFEIVIADDASTDPATIAELQRLQKEHSHDLHVVFREKNGGTAAVRNSALAQAHYPYIFALDADDKLSGDPKILKKGSYMDRAVTLLEENPDMVFVCSKIERFEAVRHGYYPIPKFDEKELLVNHNVGPFIIYRRAEALAIGGYNTAVTYAEDWDFNVAMVNARHKAEQAAQVHRYNEPFIMYRMRANHSSKTDQRTETVRSQLEEVVRRSPEIYAKHFPGLKGSALIDHVLAEQKKFSFSLKKQFVFDCLRDPREAYTIGAIGFAAESLQRKFAKALRHLTREPDAAPQSAPRTPVHTL